MKRTGYADLPLHYGHVPPWLYERMERLAGAVVELLVTDYGRGELLHRLSDPFWFQSFGALLGMDWHSSGITTTVMGALKKAVNIRSKDLGIRICGGRGRFSRNTPQELIEYSDKAGLDGEMLVKTSRLTAKIDNTAIQDGFNVYLHSFVVTVDGEWTVVQQGMDERTGLARRYHWNSGDIKSFVHDPHRLIFGQGKGLIMNLVHRNAQSARDRIQSLAKENPSITLPEIRKILMPHHHDVRKEDVNLKRLAAVLALAYEHKTDTFEDLLITPGLGPRTLQSLALVSETIHGTPTRFQDPARFSFAHGGKDGHPAPVVTQVMDETIQILARAMKDSRLGNNERKEALKRLHQTVRSVEVSDDPQVDFNTYIRHERKIAENYGGRTVFDNSKNEHQLTLFDR